MNTLRILLDRIQASLLFVPILFVAGAIALEFAVGAIDQSGLGAILPFIVEVSQASARSVLVTVAGATLTAAVFVLSITAVTIQLAASQYTPRLVQGFLRDRFQQSVVGVVVATFIYCLLSLGSVDRQPPDPTPNLVVTVAIILGLISILAIISYIDVILRRIVIDNTMRRVAAATVSSLQRHRATDQPETQTLEERSLPDGEPVTVRSEFGGWIRSVSTDRILGSVSPGTVVRLNHRVGDRVVPGEPLAQVWGANPEEMEGSIRRSLVLGEARTVELDPSFGFRQLVDIALRALSPGINDPTTAADVVRHLVEPLAIALEAKPQGRSVNGDEGRRVYIPETMTHRDYVRAAFTEIRMHAVTQPYVVQALVDALDAVHHRLHGEGYDGRCGPLLTESEAMLEGVESSTLPPDQIEYLGKVITGASLVREHGTSNGE